ncbi:hypothetical protein B0H12DRAFT_1231700 [Mycena haematopus]|nr:hypothetical protein B0H12DRAFT_1231700 [Mycena haematopus]
MRVVSDDEDTNESIPDTESSITESYSVWSSTEDDSNTPNASHTQLGNYNPGPVCVVCQDCALVIRQVAATPENGLMEDQTYTVCEHLAHIGVDPSLIPIAEDNPSDDILNEDSIEGVNPALRDIPLNRLGDPDFEPGIIIDITNPIPAGIYSVAAEIHAHEEARTQAGMRSLTALEYYVNTQWLTHYRYYPSDPSGNPEYDYFEYADQGRDGGLYGQTLRRARTMLREITEAKSVVDSIYPEDGDFFCNDFILEKPLQIVSNALAPHNILYNLQMRELHLLGRAIIARTQYHHIIDRGHQIDAELNNAFLRGHALEQWERARLDNNELRGVSYYRDMYMREVLQIRRTLDRFREGEVTTVEEMRAANLASIRDRVSRAVIVEGQENLGPMPLDEAALWMETTPLSNSELDLLQASTQPPVIDDTPSDPRTVILAGDTGNMDGFTTPAVDDEDEYDRQRGTGYTWAQELAHREAVMELNRPRGWSGPNGSDEEYLAATRWPYNSDSDDESMFAARVTSSPRIEHSGTIKRATEIGLLDQPLRDRENSACISVLLKINNTDAYVLIDSGSTTNSMTPEFAHATRAAPIKLDEQVTLQLGCVGSRSRINYGTRVPIDFGGIRGYVYFDIVNLDRYDCIIGTPFLNRHGVLIDFGNRELQFGSGQRIKALPLPSEKALLHKRSTLLPTRVNWKKPADHDQTSPAI